MLMLWCARPDIILNSQPDSELLELEGDDALQRSSSSSAGAASHAFESLGVRRSESNPLPVTRNIPGEAKTNKPVSLLCPLCRYCTHVQITLDFHLITEHGYMVPKKGGGLPPEPPDAAPGHSKAEGLIQSASPTALPMVQVEPPVRMISRADFSCSMPILMLRTVSSPEVGPQGAQSDDGHESDGTGYQSDTSEEALVRVAQARAYTSESNESFRKRCLSEHNLDFTSVLRRKQLHDEAQTWFMSRADAAVHAAGKDVQAERDLKQQIAKIDIMISRAQVRPVVKRRLKQERQQLQTRLEACKMYTNASQAMYMNVYLCI